MEHASSRALSALVFMGLLAASTSIPVAAQDPPGSSSELSALCEVNAPDETTQAACLEVVETVLAPSGEDLQLVAVPSADEFMARMVAVLPDEGSVGAGSLIGQEASTKRTKPPTKKQRQKLAKQELAAARQYSDQTREYLLSVTPDPCFANMYASAWGVATALQQWADGALKQPELLLFNTYSQFMESPQAISCGEPVTDV